MSNLQKFWKRIAFDSSGCWFWLGSRTDKGYGHFYIAGHRFRAHKWIWEQFNGAVPVGYELHHKCEKRNCVNPVHLSVVTHARNMALGKWAKATHCIRGHEFTPENTRVRRLNGQRVCRKCDNER